MKTMEKLTKEQIIEQRKQFPKVQVRDSVQFDWQDAVLIDQHTDGSCFATTCIEDYYSGKNCGTIFKEWRYRPKPKIVPFSHGKEISWDWLFQDMMGNKYIVKGFTDSQLYLVKKSGGNSIGVGFRFAFDNYKLSKDGGKTWIVAGKRVEE